MFVVKCFEFSFFPNEEVVSRKDVIQTTDILMATACLHTVGSYGMFCCFWKHPGH